MGESLILLNKTQIYSTGANGDSKLYLNIQANILDPARGSNYKEWTYPTEQLSGAASSTGKNTWPEMIQPCQQQMANACKGKQGCGLIVGVAGLGPAMSSYRLTGFYGKNKLKLDAPVKDSQSSVKYEDHYMHYFWFAISDVARDPTATFDYQVSVATTADFNPDLYVSLMSGSYPTTTDYDLASAMLGADSIRISSWLPLWAERGWDPAAGVVVVVGVKLKTEDVPYTLLLSSNEQVAARTVRRLGVGEGLQGAAPAVAAVNGARAVPAELLLRVYNWEHRNIKVTLSVTDGAARVMLQQTGQKDLANNIYTADPIDESNALEYRDVQAGATDAIPIAGGSCYTCWYFIKVQVTDPRKAAYRIAVSRDDEAGPEDPQLVNGVPAQLYVAAGHPVKRRFMLDSMDHWLLQAQVATGAVDVYVGLNSATVGPQDYLWKASSAGGVASLAIKTTDVRFHLATFYYVSVQAVSDADALINLSLKQQRTVAFIPNNHDYTFALTRTARGGALLFQKYQFTSVQEQVKFHVFYVPRASRNSAGSLSDVYFRVKISINQLSPGFYPTLYLKHMGFASRPASLAALPFPTIAHYDMEFGGNPFAQLTKTKFEYTFTGISDQYWSLYTMALYQHTWGLTDMRKSEYEIMVQADAISKADYE
jgi:hypothetical protein